MQMFIFTIDFFLCAHVSLFSCSILTFSFGVATLREVCFVFNYSGHCSRIGVVDGERLCMIQYLFLRF